MNSALLEKLKQELVGLKTRFAENQTELSTARNEALKLKKQKDPVDNELQHIVPGLQALTIHQLNADQVPTTSINILHYEDLAMQLRQALLNGQNIRMDFTFHEDSIKIPGKVKKIKSTLQSNPRKLRFWHHQINRLHFQGKEYLRCIIRRIESKTSVDGGRRSRN